MDDKALETQVEALLGKLTLTQKVSLLAGQDFWSLPAIEKAGIPSLRVSDGPTGLRSTNSEPATVFPVGVALAATWDRALVAEVGAAIGREAIGHGVDVLLAPGVNIQRTPLGGRNFEYYSEDPCLAGEIGAAYVNGVQSEGVGTSVKHFAANNQEHNRLSVSANVSERVLREIYLPAFERVVTRARPWAVMSAYNRVNGVFASEHHQLLNEILKGEWGFDGVVVSDWGAAKSTAGSANGGLDLEMPGPPRHYGQALLDAVEAGEVSPATIDEHAHRVLRLIGRCGLLGDNPKTRRELPSPAAHEEVAREAAASAMVLLRNERQVLPVPSGGSIAIIGALADHPAIQGSGSSQVTPYRITTPLEGLRAALGDTTSIVYERGCDPEPHPPIVDGRLLSPEPGSSEQGLVARYFAAPGCQGEACAEGLEWHFAKLGFGATAQNDVGAFSVEWRGFFTPKVSGLHEWLLTHSGPDAELILGDEVLVGADTPRGVEMLFEMQPLHRRKAVVELDAGKPYPIRIRYGQPDGIKGFNVFNVCLRQPRPDRKAALTAAREADRAIVFVGSGTTSETEGKDRASMTLSDAQNGLVSDIAALNDNTIVVVNTGGPVETPWADEVAAILQLWLPGQEGGHALADVVTGRVNPSGKLPISFPRHYADNPSYLHYPGGQDADYGEGLFVGYRYYDSANVEPLFPFGHGLSYTEFRYDALQVPSTACAGDTVAVTVQVTNVGPVAGAEVVQVYVQNHACPETRPLQELRAFRKVHLDPGNSATINFDLDSRCFAWWDRHRGNWTVTPGDYRICAGGSSRDLPVSAEVNLRSSSGSSED